MAVKETPIYLFTGFLDSGKTTFIQETMEDPGFNDGEKTMLLVTEEGDEEYHPAKFASSNCKTSKTILNKSSKVTTAAVTSPDTVPTLVSDLIPSRIFLARSLSYDTVYANVLPLLKLLGTVAFTEIEL